MKKIQKILFVVVMLLAGTSAFAQLPKTTVTVVPLPQTLTVTGNSVCVNTDGKLTLLAAEKDVLYQVHSGSYGGDVVASGTPASAGDYDILVHAADLTNQSGANTFYVTGTRTNSSPSASCPANVGSGDITVVPSPTMAGITIPTAASGTGVSASLSYTSTTASQYKIDFGSAAITAGFANVGVTNITSSPISIAIPDNVAAGPYTATLTVRNATGCETTYPITINVESVTASISGTLCETNPASINVTFTGTGPWTIKLSDNNTYTVNGPAAGTYPITLINPTYSSPSSSLTILSLSGVNGAGTGTGSITVFPKSTVAITSDQVVCANGSLASNIEVTLTGASSNGTTGWSFEYTQTVNGTTTPLGPISGTTNKLTIPTTTFSQTTEYQLTKVTDANGCPVTN
jgi:hypothetical protein